MAKNKLIQIRIDEDLKNGLKIAADADSRSMSDYICLLIKRDLAQKNILKKF